MATTITFHPLVDGVLTLARLEQPSGGRTVVEEYALEHDAHTAVAAALAAAGDDPPPLDLRRIVAYVRRVGWRHVPTAA